MRGDGGELALDDAPDVDGVGDLVGRGAEGLLFGAFAPLLEAGGGHAVEVAGGERFLDGPADGVPVHGHPPESSDARLFGPAGADAVDLDVVGMAVSAIGIVDDRQVDVFVCE